MSSKLKDAKILLWDLETLPIMAFVWGMWKQNVRGQAILKDKSIICGSYKWLHERKVHTLSIGDDAKAFKKDPYNDRVVVERMIPLLEEADFCVAHNGDKFDYRILKAQGIIHGLPGFRARKVDTLSMAKAAGLFPRGNKLEDLAEVLGVARKGKVNYDWWKRIALDSCPASLAKMVKYCEQDVKVLEALFLKLLPHAENVLPDINLLTGGDRDSIACNRCGSEKIYKHGKYMKNVLVYQRYKCQTCGSTFIGRKALNAKRG
jgi:DNA polymerase III alpha subunit (gram-positive type)